ncbi:MAG: hypothetical protein IAF08_04880 [Rhizobacter sp.]|nr:hypothetical protein [Chlorobiales bacterium]
MDDKYLEHFAAMVEELRSLNKKFDRLETQQVKTNMLLSTHTRDLMKIVEILEAISTKFMGWKWSKAMERTSA